MATDLGMEWGPQAGARVELAHVGGAAVGNRKPWDNEKGLSRLQGWRKVFLASLQLLGSSKGGSAHLAGHGEERALAMPEAGDNGVLTFSEHLLVLRAPG